MKCNTRLKYVNNIVGDNTKSTHTYLPIYLHIDRQTHTQTDRHRDIHKGKQTDRHIYIKNGFEKYIRLYVFVNSYFFLQFKT